MTTRLRIAHIVPRLAIGGMVTQLSQQLKFLGPDFRQQVFSIFSAADEISEKWIGSDIIRLGRNPDERSKIELISKQIYHSLSMFKPDVICSYHVFTDIYIKSFLESNDAIAIRHVLGFSQVSMFDKFQDGTVIMDWSPEVLKIERSVDDHFAINIAVSYDIASQLRRSEFTKKPIKVIYPGVINDEKNRYPTQREGEMHVAFLNRLEPIKQPMEFLKIARRIADSCAHAKFHVLEKGSLLDDFKSEAEVYRLTRTIEYVSVQSNVWRSVHSVNALLFTSAHEGVPLLAIEAMSRGIPVVGYRVGGLPELVSSGHNGFLVDPGDIDGMARAVLEVSRCRQFSVRSAEAAKKRFSLSDYLSQLRELYSVRKT